MNFLNIDIIQLQFLLLNFNITITICFGIKIKKFIKSWESDLGGLYTMIFSYIYIYLRARAHM